MAPGFSSPPDPNAYQQAVWELVRLIPIGKVATYGQIANLIPPPEGMGLKDYRAFAPRWVGGAMARCPEDVPWQRVINAQGKISLRPGAGAAQQQQMLEAEGIEFDDRQRVNLKHYQWTGPDSE